MQKKERPTIGEGSARISIFVDSSAWIALFSARDQHHAESDLLFRRVVAGGVPLLTTILILAEIHRLLLYRAGIEAAAAALDRIQASSLVTIVFPSAQAHRVALAWLARLPHEPISYTDAMSFTIMASRRCRSAISFDRDFEAAGFKLCQPEDL